MVHHALCALTEPRFERLFLLCSHANRVGKGTHRAVLRVRQLASRHRWALRCDVQQHFASIDHGILRRALATQIDEAELMTVTDRILASGEWAADDAPDAMFFPGDDLLDACRPRGLPIGNLTSQFWSNVFMHNLDAFVVRSLGITAYVRYVDDIVLFDDSRSRLWDAQRAIVERLDTLRLRLHEHSAQVQPCATGIPWLGMVVYPDHVRVKARKVRQATRSLGHRYEQMLAGQISFGEFDASVQGWINLVAQADTWGLRRHVLSPFLLPHGAMPAYAGRQRGWGR